MSFLPGNNDYEELIEEVIEFIWDILFKDKDWKYMMNYLATRFNLTSG